MTQSEISGERPTQNDENFVRASLHQLFYASTKSCRYLGLTIFSLNSKGEYYFGFFTIPFFLVSLRFLSIVLATVYFHFNKDKFNLIYPERSKTETVAQFLLAGNMFFGDVLCTFVTFLNRKKILNFYQNFAKFLIEVVGPLTQTDKQVIKSIIPETLKILKRYKRIIFVAFLYSIVAGYVNFFKALITTGKSWQSWSHTIVGIPIFNILRAVTSTFRLFPRLLMTTVLHAFSLCPYVINMQLKNVKKFEKVADEEIHRLMRYFKQQGNLTAQMNEAFGWGLAVDMVLIIITIITALFSVVVFLVNNEFVAVVSFGVPLILHVAILFELFNAGYCFESESKKSAMLLKNIPTTQLGRISRAQVNLAIKTTTNAYLYYFYLGD
ncbi:unnamed protein product [Orchesella dallaii]|uniref:Gustatory receptor n=1 Tax=Orchesella dallaii TaxID=48710 RepID=A0ABP1R331_9HEXA